MNLCYYMSTYTRRIFVIDDNHDKTQRTSDDNSSFLHIHIYPSFIRTFPLMNVLTIQRLWCLGVILAPPVSLLLDFPLLLLKTIKKWRSSWKVRWPSYQNFRSEWRSQYYLYLFQIKVKKVSDFTLYNFMVYFLEPILQRSTQTSDFTAFKSVP